MDGDSAHNVRLKVCGHWVHIACPSAHAASNPDGRCYGTMVDHLLNGRHCGFADAADRARQRSWAISGASPSEARAEATRLSDESKAVVVSARRAMRGRHLKAVATRQMRSALARIRSRPSLGAIQTAKAALQARIAQNRAIAMYRRTGFTPVTIPKYPK